MKYIILKNMINNSYDINKSIDNMDNTFLHIACECGYYKLVKYLILNGSDVNKENKNKETPIMFSCKTYNKKIFKILFKNGSHLNCINKDGENLVHFACKFNNLLAIKFFINNNFFNYISFENYENPLNIALMYGTGEISKYLYKFF